MSLTMSAEMLDLFFSSFGETLLMVGVSSVIGALLGIRMEIFLYLTDDEGIRPHIAFNRGVGVIVNVVRSTPLIILLVALIPLRRFFVDSSIGTTAAIMSLTIAAAPFVARLVETALR